MTSEHDINDTTSTAEADVKLIQDFIHAMTVAANKLRSYPEGHPQITESYEKVEQILALLFETHSQITLIIAKNTIMLGASTLDPHNIVFQRFAGLLFGHGIIGLTLRKGLSSAELMAFSRIIFQSRKDIQRQGGVNKLLAQGGISYIQTKLIDYGLIHKEDGLEENISSEDDLPASFWEKFVQGFFEGILAPEGVSEEAGFGIEPETLADMLNKHCQAQAIRTEYSFASGMKNLDVFQLAGDAGLLKQVVRFVKSLSKDLRQAFLETFLQNLPDDDDAVRNIIGGLPMEIIIEAIESNTSNGHYIPPNILKIAQKLAQAQNNVQNEDADTLLGEYSREELIDKLKMVFKEDEADQYLPKDYQEILKQFIDMEDISLPDLSEVPQLAETLTGRSIDSAFTSIVLNIINGYDDTVPGVLIQSLRDRSLLLIRDRNIQKVCEILEAVGQKTVLAPDGQTSAGSLKDVMADREFTYEVLKAFSQQGTDKHLEISKLIVMVGSPFIEPLLDRLAEEEIKALRLYYLSLFKSLGGSVKEHVLMRIKDRRWYYVRNLLIILRQLEDPSVLDAVRGLFGSSNARIRQELLHTFLALGDNEAEGILIEELKASDFDRCLKAISLAGMTSNKEITEILTGFLKKRGLDKTSFEIKKATVKALADVGDPSALPVLVHVLGSFSFFSRQNSNLLKLEVIESLGKYPAAEATPILKKISQGRSILLASRASQVMKTLREIQS